MRRKDREMSPEYGLELIDKVEYGVLSMVDGSKPYGVPLSIVRVGNNLYFHSAKEGKKVDIFSKNDKVNIAFVGEVKVSEKYAIEDLDSMDEKKRKSALKEVFTTEFESAIVEGVISLVEKDEERVMALQEISKKYTPSKMRYFDEAVRSGLPYVAIYRVNIESVTAKKKALTRPK